MTTSILLFFSRRMSLPFTVMVTLLLLCPVVRSSALAQESDMGFGISVSGEHRLMRGMKLQAEAEVRSQDVLSQLERWAIGLSLDYRLTDYLKSDVGYCLMDRFHLAEYTDRGNRISGYWAPRHRWYASLQGQYVCGRFKVSLRERYQLTHSPLQYVPKYVVVHGDPDYYGYRLTDEVKAGHQDHLLRQRLQVSYDVRHSHLTPSVSIEALHDLSQAFAVGQVRYCLSLDYQLGKHSSVGLLWRYTDRTDDDERNGHLISLGYNFSF